MTKAIPPSTAALIDSSARAFARRLGRMPAREVLRRVHRDTIPVHFIARRSSGGAWTMRWHLGLGCGEDATARTRLDVRDFRYPVTESEDRLAGELVRAARSAFTSSRTAPAV